MKWRRLAVLPPVLLSTAALTNLAVPVPVSVSYTGPCDLTGVVCAEAYSVDRAQTVNYSGPLFQLDNGSAQLDIGQTGTHTADMTTWSAFCSGVQSNCKYLKIYAQIQGHSNDFVPSQIFNGQTNCTPSATTCAAPFKIEAATGLPAVDTTVGQEYLIGGATDTAAIGITAGNAAISVLMNFKVKQVAQCCGSFGVSHIWNGGNVAGSDFILFQGWDAAPATCQVAGEYCLAVDLEYVGSPVVDNGLTLGDNIVFGATFAGTGTNVIKMYKNASLILTRTLVTTQNPGSFMRLGGGGDLTQPADTYWRGGLITNSELSSTAISLIQSNETAFYSALTFP